jgi:hypothetical protein
MKLVDKLFCNKPAPWKDWILRDAASFDTPSNGSHSYLWKIINDELTTYHSITFVNVRNGASTSFWFDHRLPAGSLYTIHAALFSHTARPNVSVQEIFRTGFDLRLRPRLTNAASSQLAKLLTCLQGFHLRNEPDDRRLKLTGKAYTTKAAYMALDPRAISPDMHGSRIWNTQVLNKVKIFAWLYFKDRLSMCSILFAKHILEDDMCCR